MSRKDKRSSRDAPSSPVAQLFATAVRHHQAGQFADADLHYRQALAIEPKPCRSVRGLARAAIPAAARRVMRLGLYSALGRRDVAAVRQFVAARGYSGEPASNRACCQELLGFAPGTPQHTMGTSDFFSISECRDLLFHVQEHNLSLPQIADFIGANALTFLGFEGCATGYQRYAQLFPDDPPRADLTRWARIEREHPRRSSTCTNSGLRRWGDLRCGALFPAIVKD